MKHLFKSLWNLITEPFTFLSILIDEDKRSDLDGYWERRARK